MDQIGGLLDKPLQRQRLLGPISIRVLLTANYCLVGLVMQAELLPQISI